MDVQKIYTQLTNSFNDFKSRNGELSLDNVCAEAINNACLDILKARRNRSSNYSVEEEIRMAYLACTQTIIPEFTGKYLTTADFGILQNVEWEGMWAHLRQYFREKHGISIDDVNSKIISFISNKQLRFEDGALKSTSFDKREIIIEFLNETIYWSNNLNISIKPNLSLKSASLTRLAPDIGIYSTENGEYKFLIYGLNIVSKVVVILEDRNLKFEYLKE